eukprot:6331235-Karenia_brevis.AAC.1
MSKTDIPGVEGESGDLTKKSQKHAERSSEASRGHVRKTREGIENHKRINEEITEAKEKQSKVKELLSARAKN